MAKNEFVEGYKKYQNSEDLSLLVDSVVIPYFEPLACDLEELVDLIKSQTDESIQVLDYLELVFDSKLYDSYLDTINLKSVTNSSDNYSHYLVILIEFTKYQQYQDIKQKLTSIENNQKDQDKTFIQDLLMKATEERSQYCLDKMKKVHMDLITNHTSCYNSITACDELLNSNNINLY
jgi:hypothetical protein